MFMGCLKEDPLLLFIILNRRAEAIVRLTTIRRRHHQVTLLRLILTTSFELVTLIGEAQRPILLSEVITCKNNT